jgi:hypothetical protein
VIWLAVRNAVLAEVVLAEVVIARSAATKQSRGWLEALDCFAPLAMTAGEARALSDRTAFDRSEFAQKKES